jgi:hypothetical protein
MNGAKYGIIFNGQTLGNRKRWGYLESWLVGSWLQKEMKKRSSRGTRAEHEHVNHGKHEPKLFSLFLLASSSFLGIERS